MLTADPNSTPLFPNGARSRLSHAQFEKLHALSRSALVETSYPDLFRSLGDFSRDIGAGAVNCAIFDNSGRGLVGVSSTMSPQAVNRYFSENMAIDDPLIPRIHTDPQPALLGWGLGVTPLWQQGNSARLLEGMQKDGYHGLAYFPVPVAGGPFSATITFRNELEPERGRAFLNSEFGLLQLAADIIGHRAAALFQGRATGEHWHAFTPPVLSPREREIVCWLAAGLRTDQIAYQLDLKPVTIHMHLRSARRKLGARTREQMMALAALRGFL
jgi:DNA-binding CsgD family transcriptional regulator